MQFDRTVDGMRIVNAGSVGMPYGVAGAYWLLLGPEIMLRRTLYDLEDAAARIKASGWPRYFPSACSRLLASAHV